MLRRNQWIAVLFVLVAGSVSVTGQSRELEESELTAGRANGRAWEGMPAQVKIMYLYGVESGLALAADVSGDAKTYDQLTVTGFKFGDLATEIDAFYGDRSNLRIPVTFAYVYVTKKIRGDSPQTLGLYVAELRRRWNQ